MQRKRFDPNDPRIHSIFGYVVFWIGMLLTIVGLCILLVNLLLRH